MLSLHDLQTPCLLLDRVKMERNFGRLRTAALRAGTDLRPHLKTAKSVDLARHLLPEPDAKITVSTLKEAEVFAAAGYRDILYAVGITEQKLPRAAELLKAGVRLTLTVDAPHQAEAIATAAEATGLPFRAVIELDCDGHRSGVAPDDEVTLCAVAAPLAARDLFAGVMTHCGSSYGARSTDELTSWAERERDAARRAAKTLRNQGHAVEMVSIGSTPTALTEIDLDGITELRAGVGMFFDLVQCGTGICTAEEIALSVLTTVIGRSSSSGRLLIDAGWMALSRDRGTASQPIDQLYGLVCHEDGSMIPDVLVIDTNQEHGAIGLRPGSRESLPDFAPGTRLRILPNHACATAAQHSSYHVIDHAPGVIEGNWPRFMGW